MKANAQYVVSYGTTQNYADSINYFGGTKTNADGTLSVSGAAGVFNAKAGFGTGPDHFPTSTWNASNYWADVVFKASPAASASEEPASLILTGTSSAESLTGGAGGDTMRGLKGDDRIQGNGGADDLRGGGGSDAFIYVRTGDSTPVASDTIRDFHRGVDKIDLTAIDAIAGGGNNGDGTADLSIKLDAHYHAISFSDVLL